MTIHWRLKEILQSEGISVYALAEEMGGPSRRPALYAITSSDVNKRPSRVGLPLLEAILDGLKNLTGKNFSVADILESSDVT